MLIVADARRLPLRDRSVQAAVTSPPYWGLRDYGPANQIGLEATPEAYVCSLRGVFAEVWRVLRDDGTVWLNIGDSYATGAGSVGECPGGGKQGESWRLRGLMTPPNRMPIEGLKPKDLVGIPWRVAFALQDQGWYLRSDIIWAKPNPMPESVTDRPTKSHEYLFLLSKSERYYYDADAIAEPCSESMHAQVEQGYEGLGLKDYERAGVQNPSSVKARIIANARRKQDAVGKSTYVGFNDRYDFKAQRLTRNARTVWTVNTEPYAGAHLATMPEALVEPCVLAGCPVGGLVLDPFLGTGTVGAVSERLGRRWVGTDLSYQPLAQERTAQRGIRW